MFRCGLLFSAKMLTVQLLAHEGTDTESTENTVTNMIQHMNWEPGFAQHVCRFAIQHQYITRQKNALMLTDLGREVAKSALTMS